MATATRTRAGDLNQRIAILAIARVPDGGGGYEETLVPAARVWAKVIPLSGAELIAAQQAESRIAYQIVVRWRDDLDAAQVIEWRGKRLNILAVQDGGPQSGYVTLAAESEIR